MKLLKHAAEEMTKCSNNNCPFWAWELYSLEGEEKKLCNDCILSRLLDFEVMEKK